MKAYLRGYQAYESGASIDENPYTRGSSFDRWRYGWTVAQKDRANREQLPCTTH